MLVDIDEGNNEGVCDDVLDMEKIVTNVPEYPDEPEFTLDPRAEDKGPLGM
jgi:hypothetical protein